MAGAGTPKTPPGRNPRTESRTLERIGTFLELERMDFCEGKKRSFGMPKRHCCFQVYSLPEEAAEVLIDDDEGSLSQRSLRRKKRG